jgi:hypothetical protein
VARDKELKLEHGRTVERMKRFHFCFCFFFGTLRHELRRESKDLPHYDSTCDGFQVDRHHVAFSTVPFTRGDEYGSLTV